MTRRQRRLLDDPTSELKHCQESLVMKHVVDGFEESDADLPEALVTTVVRSLRMRWPKRQAGMSGRSTGLSTGWNTS
jgi:hypothetical protein